MNINIRSYTETDSDLKIWNNILQRASSVNFLNSIEWINFQKSYEKNLKLFQFIIELNNEPVGVWFIKVAKRKISKQAFSPSGPVFIDNLFKIKDINTLDFWKEIAVFGKKFCKDNNLNLFKIEPLLIKNEDTTSALKLAGWKNSYSMGGAKDTWQTDLGVSIDDLIKEFKKDTRYYIKRAEKKGVKIRMASSVEDVKLLADLMRETMERKGFNNYPSSYFLDQWKTLSNTNKPLTKVWLAELDIESEGKITKKVLSASLMNYYRDTVYYSHGASISDLELQKYASPYLLHFKIMEDAIKNGFKKYNWWGVVPSGLNHPYRGLSDFKMKFKGNHIKFVGTYEVYNNFVKGYINRFYDWWTYRKDRY